VNDLREQFVVGKAVRVTTDCSFGPGFYYKAGDEALVEDGTENGTGRIEDEDPEYVLVRFTSGEHSNSQQYIPYQELELV